MRNQTSLTLRRNILSILVSTSILMITACSAAPATPVELGSTAVDAAPTATAAPQSPATPAVSTVWIDPATPAFLAAQIQLPAGFEITASAADASFTFAPSAADGQVYQIYGLAAPFFTLRDDFSSSELKKFWTGKDPSMDFHVEQSTFDLFTRVWGTAGSNVKTVSSLNDLQLAADDAATLFLFPLETMQPDWKLLRVDGFFPLTHELDLNTYSLAIPFSFQGMKTLPAELTSLTLTSNFDPEMLSIVVMTGTTALTRATANRMDLHGVTWPGEDIGPYLRDADITHISNEVSFYEFCAKGNPNETSMMFCSRPEYLELLKDVGADVIELTGNHNLDYGKKPYTDSLAMYAEAGMQTYAGGLTEEAARSPLLIEDHGNKFAFLGCNFVGPKFAMATVNTMGAAHCDFEWFEAKLTELRQQGYLPIFTFQYSEYLIHKPGEHQERDYRRMADAGAVVVSGSQAHYPQVMALYNDNFIHYGLGNLFFDQMDRPVVGTREEFIDRHYFYNGRYLGTELVTALLEDYARPRPMTEDERYDFLTRIFIEALPEKDPTPSSTP